MALPALGGLIADAQQILGELRQQALEALGGTRADHEGADTGIAEHGDDRLVGHRGIQGHGDAPEASVPNSAVSIG
jgi:hypothetical protein